MLYDELVFEDGLYRVEIAEDGGWAESRELGGLAGKDLGREIKIGEHPQLQVRAACNAMDPSVKGRVAATYVAEWRSDVIDDLASLGRAWATTIALPDPNPNLGRPKSFIDGAEVEAALERAALSAEAQNPVVLDWLIPALVHDAAVAASMSAALDITGLFAPLLTGSQAKQDPSGNTALGILIPNVGMLPWEKIAEFREHPGAEDARGKLRAFEQQALSADPADPLTCHTEVFRAISGALIAAIKDLEGSLPADLVEEAAKTAISLVPLVGPFIEKGASLAETLYQANRHRHTWYAAVMKLHNSTTGSAHTLSG